MEASFVHCGVMCRNAVGKLNDVGVLARQDCSFLSKDRNEDNDTRICYSQMFIFWN
jgi:hypothetical protein